ncbi:MAG: hypothetical protein IT179_13735 [Acidobacteria bacterium]|nr:hypothetical protein [Acidobacteriota bacterium]
MSDASPAVPGPAHLADEQGGKRLRKLERMLDTRALEPWERYRALMDALDTYSDLSEQGDRKTRFALIIMGLLNAVNFLLVARSDVFGVMAGSLSTGLAAYAALYAFLSLYFFSQAIQALRPRSARFFRDDDSAGAGARRLRSMAHVAAQPPDQYYEFWCSAHVGQLCREVAFTAQALAAINMDKYRALERVYTGLIALTALTALLLTGLAYTGLHR